MTRILGIDPGATTGWCVYDTVHRSVCDRGHLVELGDDAKELAESQRCWDADHIVIEQPKGYGPTRPQLVDCAWIAGRIFQAMRHWGRGEVHALTRLEVKQVLTEATSREVMVRTDASAWAALKLLHGGEACAKKGGTLYGVKAHERAALAVAVAYAIKQANVAVATRGML